MTSKVQCRSCPCGNLHAREQGANTHTHALASDPGHLRASFSLPPSSLMGVSVLILARSGTFSSDKADGPLSPSRAVIPGTGMTWRAHNASSSECLQVTVTCPANLQNSLARGAKVIDNPIHSHRSLRREVRAHQSARDIRRLRFPLPPSWALMVAHGSMVPCALCTIGGPVSGTERCGGCSGVPLHRPSLALSLSLWGKRGKSPRAQKVRIRFGRMVVAVVVMVVEHA